MLGLRFTDSPRGIQLVGNINEAIKQRDLLRRQNPNFILLVAINYYSGIPAGAYPDDWQHWLRDKNGEPISTQSWGSGRLDFTQPETQKWVIDQAIAVAHCGIFDGIFLDHWNENPRLHEYYSIEVEHAARDTILKGIRAEVGEDFLILVNTNESKIPRWAEYVNGTFMETQPSKHTSFNIYQSRGYSAEDLPEIESTLLWSEMNMREPQINALEGIGLIEEMPDSPRNLQWMRLFTTMSLTHSDGYVLYTIGSASLHHEHPWDNMFLSQTSGHINQRPHVHDHDHYWYDFWDANLGRPVGEKAKHYEDREGLFIREFTNGWAVYNRSGKEQSIEFPESVSGVASGVKTQRSHVLPDLDGEIYLKSGLETPLIADVNGDGIVNIIDLVVVANAFGKDTPDVNGDGIVNVLDLVLVSNNFGE